jgi:hypothetical protein
MSAPQIGTHADGLFHVTHMTLNNDHLILKMVAEAYTEVFHGIVFHLFQGHVLQIFVVSHPEEIRANARSLRHRVQGAVSDVERALRSPDLFRMLFRAMICIRFG